MKHLILSLSLIAFAFGLQAADTKAKAAADKPSCCAAAKNTAASTECPMAKGTCSKMAKTGKTGVAKQALLSPKAASFASR